MDIFEEILCENGIGEPTWKAMGQPIEIQKSQFELVWHTLQYEDGKFYRSIKIHRLGNCTSCYTVQLVGSRCIECNIFQQPGEDVYYCKTLYFGHDDKQTHQMILDGQQQAKPKVLSELAGPIPFADLDGERFVDQYDCQPVVVDLLCYLRELSRHDRLSPIVPGIYDVVADTTGAREETLEWAIGVLMGPPCHYFTEEETQTVLNSHHLR